MVLLANHDKRFRRNSRKMGQVSALCLLFKSAPKTPVADHQSLVVRQMGYRLDRPLPNIRAQAKFAIVAIDYFTKWVEAEANCKNFILKNIVCRFRLPTR
ncbi:hypothetical protein TorRG33x02_178840 [Trema orientale]|uniref:Uncharacterized protein n=1 Tax=Trema orientale TaxID=63057 RepID=A0A2P5EL83_TREOI|nr:hypothetical protein TorRG33x02_178840 [Trema orientale]